MRSKKFSILYHEEREGHEGLRIINVPNFVHFVSFVVNNISQ